jgi:T-complex protein 1 subunit delta
MKQIFLDFSGTIEETKLIDGLILDQKTIGFGAPTRIEKAKIGLIQFCISPPKTDVKKILHLFFPQNNLDGKYSDYQ